LKNPSFLASLPALLFLAAPCSAFGAAEGSTVQNAALVTYRLQLAQQRVASIEIRDGAVIASMKGMEVKRFSISKAELSSHAFPRLSTVATKTAAVRTRQVIVKVEQVSADPSETVSSPDEIVSVEDMPETFALKLKDGSVFYITGKSRDGILNGWRKDWLKCRVGCTFLFRQLRGLPVCGGIIEMDPTSARHLFWLIRPEMGVIY